MNHENRMTTLDAGFLQAEDSDRHVSLAIGGLALLAGPVPDQSVLRRTLGERMRACPRFSQRIQLHPFDIGPPEWVDDDDFDITRHVRRIGVPQPGGDAELHRLVAEVMAWRLDRSRPLWEIWVIEGLSEGRWAMLMKVHHCIADGIATAHMLAGLADGGAGAAFAERTRAAGPAAATSTVAAAAVDPRSGGLDPLHWIGGLRGAASAMAAATVTAVQGASELAAGLIGAAPTSSLNGPMTNLRRFGAVRIALADVRRVCATFDVTVNDVALAALAESYRNTLIRHGEQPQHDSLRTLVPVSVRSLDEFDKTDNRVSVMLPYLPVEEANPVQRLRMVHARLTRTKSAGQRQAGSAVVALANRVPYPLTAWTVRLATRLPQRGVVALATNVPGPRQRLSILGCPVTDVLPVPPIAMQLRTGVAILSYGDDLYFGILADFDAVPDIDELARGVQVAVDRLVAASKRRKTARHRHGLQLVVNG